MASLSYGTEGDGWRVMEGNFFNVMSPSFLPDGIAGLGHRKYWFIIQNGFDVHLKE